MKLLALVFGGLILGLAVAGFFFLLKAPADFGSGAAEKNGKIIFEVSAGESVNQIAAALKEQNLVSSAAVFKIYSLLLGRADLLKPGRYLMETPESIPNIVEMLWTGPKDVALTIAPGMTAKEVDDKLTALGLIKSGDLAGTSISPEELGHTPSLPEQLTILQETTTIQEKEGLNPEGFLLPDTYYFSPAASKKAILKKVLDNFKNKALPLFVSRDKLLPVLTLASILEKEAPDEGDRRIIAGILGKRMKAGMPLQVDATVIYAKCGGRFWGCSELTLADFKIDSPYNTYLYRGWPAGPIANPGLTAIKSALNPLKSDYWYYLSDPKTKKIIFAKTLDEQKRNRSRYLLAD